ncbi:hypothetical protein Q9299_12255 [Gemmobacter fulvus]|uniref:hypothetical protein n=1 Tax=Gemmobacter fulvus TaxID=2840474 RepID=UPI0027967ED4|nr:hypothetical protein [Gemmobacter fulvus]MDQ1849064.1 hypothetical protein [Gemmobacter fulvus]
MRRVMLPLMLLSPLALAACSAPVPDSASGVGFGEYGSYEAQREAALRNGAPVLAPGAQPIVPGGVAAQPLGTPPANGFSTERLGAAIDRAAGGGAVPPVPVVIGSPNAGAVIGSTAPAAAPLAASPMTAVTPVMPAPAVPLAPRSSSGPNIVDFALKTANPVGTPVYSRSSLQLRSAESACAAFASADLAQTAFLEAGGPDKDRKGLDPDGDGFACSWDPSPFRNAVQ